MHDWLEWYVQQVEQQKEWSTFRDRYLCPCCFMPTLTSRAAYDMCGLCDWEDDGQDSDDADAVRGGPNGNYSLREARENFARHRTMYRPSDTRPFIYEQMDRQSKDRIFRNFSIAILTGSDEHWQQALAIEQLLAEERRLREQRSH